MSRIYSNIGFSGLWNGLPVRIFMIGTLTAFQWLMYVLALLCGQPEKVADTGIATIPSKSISDYLRLVATEVICIMTT